jgi:hypothetical protein
MSPGSLSMYHLRIFCQHPTKCTCGIFAEAIDALLQGNYQDAPWLSVQAPEVVEQSWMPPVVSRWACHLPSVSYLYLCNRFLQLLA